MENKLQETRYLGNMTLQYSTPISKSKEIQFLWSNKISNILNPSSTKLAHHTNISDETLLKIY